MVKILVEIGSGRLDLDTINYLLPSILDARRSPPGPSERTRKNEQLEAVGFLRLVWKGTVGVVQDIGTGDAVAKFHRHLLATMTREG
jgi:hypothetical protein